jgi:aryl-alcohol dehydrogenase-like predicted oxidoreductase
MGSRDEGGRKGGGGGPAGSGAELEIRRCGRSGLELPVLGVGCWSFGGGAYWGSQERGEVEGVVSAALDRGCAFFDTAEVYNEGRSEEALGRALRGRRDRAIVASKISPDHCGAGMVRRHCEATLARLGSDYLDVYMLHWPLNPLAIRHFSTDGGSSESLPSLADVLAAMDELRREGKIRYVGLSNFGARQLEEANAYGLPVACNEVPWSLLSRAIEWEVLPACTAFDIGVLGYMPLMQGLLTGKYRTADELPASRARTRHFRGDRPGCRHGEPGAEPETFGAIEAIRAIADREGMPMERLAIAWCLARPGITCSITGARNAAQLEENARAAELRLAPGLVAELNAVTDPLKRVLGRSVDLYESSANPRTY